MKNAKTPGHSLTRTREKPEIVELRTRGKFAQVVVRVGEFTFRFPGKAIPTPRTERQKQIAAYLDERAICTSEELARTFGVSVHKIGRECAAIRADSRLIRLVGSKRGRVYSIWPLSEYTPAQIRDMYAKRNGVSIMWAK